MLHLRSFLVVLALAAFCGQASASQNNYLHVYYYGWFPTHWTASDPNDFSGIPDSGPRLSPSNQCASVSTTHAHTDASSTFDIATVFWPLINDYSNSDSGSNSTSTLNTHRQNILDAGVKAVIVSYGGTAGQPSATQVNYIATRMAASSSNLRVAFAIRDYTNRTKTSTKSDIQTLLGTSNQYKIQLDTYNTEDAWKGTYHPVFYLYNWSVTSTNWSDVFKKGANFRTQNNFIVLASGNAGLSAATISMNGFDGDYNYTPGKRKNANFYQNLSTAAWNYPNGGYIFSAGVSPGYNTLRTKNSKKPNGTLICKTRTQADYGSELDDAAAAQPHFLSVVSFNEWNEGSVIEPAETGSSGMSDISVSNANYLDNGYTYIGFINSSGNPAARAYLTTTNNHAGGGTWSPQHPFNVQ